MIRYRVLILFSVVVSVLLYAVPAWACIVVTPPPVVSDIPATLLSPREGMTRLHSDLLTEDSPAAWWKAHRDEVKTLLEESSANRPGGQTVARIPLEELQSMAVDLDLSAPDIGCYRQYLEYLTNRVAVQVQNRWKTRNPDWESYADVGNAVAQRLQTIARNLKANADPKACMASLQETLLRGFKEEKKSLACELVDEAASSAMYRLAQERAIMANAYKVYPERVIADAVLLIIYLNPKTAGNLPQANWDFFYWEYDGKHRDAIVECAAVLRDIGPAALPYINRALSEIEQRAVAEPKAATAADGKAASSGLPAGAGTGAVAAPASTQFATFSSGSQSKEEVEEPFMLIPMARDFLWIFGGEYDTRFYKNAAAVKILRELKAELETRVRVDMPRVRLSD